MLEKDNSEERGEKLNRRKKYILKLISQYLL